MPYTQTAEIYFVVAMMILILIISGVAVYFFFRQYNLEKKSRSKNPTKPAATKPDKEYVE